MTTVPTIAIDDTYAEIYNLSGGVRTLTDAMLDAASTVTLTDTMSNIDTNATAITADASVDTVVIEDFLGNLATSGASDITADALAAADSVTITYTGTAGTTAISTTDADDVNAVADVATVSYTLSDTYGNMISSGAAASTAIGTMLAGAATVNVDTAGSMSVAQFDVLDALTAATITGNVEDTIANLAASDAAAAIAAAGTVSISDATTETATAAEFNSLVANGVSATELVNVDISDTAANIATLSAASWIVISTTDASAASDVATSNMITVTDNGSLTGLTVAQADAIYDADGGTTNGSVYGDYTITDTAENVAGAESGLINSAQSVTVTTAATFGEATTIAALETFGGAIAYSIEDTAANIGNMSSTNVAAATDVTVTGDISLANATTISSAANSGISAYTIEDTAAVLGANASTAGVSSLSADNVTAIDGASSVTASTAALAAQGSAIAGLSTAVTYSVSDTATNAITYSSGLAEAADITITGAATTAENANTIMAAGNSGDTTIAGVTDTLVNLLTASIGSNDTITTMIASSANGANTTATAAQVTALRALDTGTNIGTLTTSSVDVTDTYAALAAIEDHTDLGTVVVSNAITMAQAEALTTGIDSYTEIRDTWTGLMNDADATASTVAGTVEMNKATAVTVTDQITIAQAESLDAATTATLAYGVTDSDANIIAAYNSGTADTKAAIVGAATITDANGNSISLVEIGGVNHISATIADMAQLSSVLTATANHLLYEVTVSDLTSDATFVPGLPTNHDFRVTDTAANLGTNNAQLLQADLVVISDSVSLAEYDAINGFVTTVTVTPTTLTDTAEVLAGDATTVGDTIAAVVASTAATVAEANTIAGATALASYSIEDAGTNFTATSAVDEYNEATNITVTGTGATDGIATNEAVTLMGATNSGTTTIAEIRDTAANLANATTGVAANVGSNDTITAIVATSGTMSVDEASALMGVASDVTFSLSDTAENLAAASSSVLNAATDITATGDTTVAQAAVIDAATNDGSNTYSIADTAANILTASTSLLETDANQEVEVTDTSVTAAIATQLGTLDSDNDDDTTTTSVTEGFSVHADGVATAGEFAIEDAQANVVATANSAAVTAASAVTLSDAALTAAQVAAADTAGDLAAGYNMSDTYANLALTQGTVGGSTVLFANSAANVTITNNLSTSQATSADSWTNTGTLTFNVSDTAARIATDQAASSVTDNAAQVTVSTAASAAEAAYISEMSNIVGGYAISDEAANIASALSTANAADTADRETVIGATSVTVTTNATVAEAAGVATEASEAYGIYNVSGISYNVEDTVENLVTGSSSTDAAALTGATTVYLKTDGDMTVAQGDVVTAFSNFGAYDTNQSDDTAGIYNIVDGFAEVQVADASLLSGAAAVTANGTGGSASTADTMNMSVLNVAATIDGMDGDDIITGTDYGDTIEGGDGTDTYVASGGTAISVTLNTSTDATVTVTGGEDDTIVNVENVTGTSGVDTIVGDSAANTIVGGAGGDNIDGAGGADTLTGGAGDDTIDLGTDTDADTVVNADIANNGTDSITNFTTAEDDIEVSIADLNALTGATTFTAGDTVGTAGTATANGAFVEFVDGDGTANVSASGYAGTFIYNADTGELIFDAAGDTSYDDTTGVVTDATSDDIVFADLGAGSTGDIVAADLTLIA